MTYRPYPPSVDLRVGCKVSWHYYATKEEAEACAVIAQHNAAVDRGNGYDHGYCSPGSITGPDHQTWKPGLWEVCTC
jgi:hypothetical protein